MIKLYVSFFPFESYTKMKFTKHPADVHVKIQNLPGTYVAKGIISTLTSILISLSISTSFIKQSANYFSQWLLLDWLHMSV